MRIVLKYLNYFVSLLSKELPPLFVKGLFYINRHQSQIHMDRIIEFSIRNKLIVVLFTLTIAGFGLYSVTKIPVGAVPDITNNQVQVITTSANLSTQEIEQYITAPVEMEMAN